MLVLSRVQVVPQLVRRQPQRLLEPQIRPVVLARFLPLSSLLGSHQNLPFRQARTEAVAER